MVPEAGQFDGLVKEGGTSDPSHTDACPLSLCAPTSVHLHQFGSTNPRTRKIIRECWKGSHPIAPGVTLLEELQSSMNIDRHRCMLAIQSSLRKDKISFS